MTLFEALLGRRPFTGETPEALELAIVGGAIEAAGSEVRVPAWLRRLVLQADAIYLDGSDPARNPAMWQPRVLKALGRMAEATRGAWALLQQGFKQVLGTIPRV